MLIDSCGKMWDEYKEELLISSVFEEPAIWNKKLKQHTNSHYLSKQWDKIAKILEIPSKYIRVCVFDKNKEIYNSNTCVLFSV